MSKIRILTSETANRIAAGEVIERPASVVKELVENAIDAEAGKIVIKVENGGRKLIQVSDDGYGMDTDDAMLALEAHATSKIQEAFDIDRIQTLGFRGEALPSIAGVSRFRLQTRTANAAAGTEIRVDGGTINEILECGCPTGTSVTVRQLFYNLPVRRKFLRTIATEQGHIQEMVLLQAMANPELGFELFFDGQAVLRVPPGGDLSTRLFMLLGRSTGESMLAVNHKEDDISVFGFVGRPGMTRTSRREQRIFINRRPAVADPVFFAIREAYHTLVMKGRYPPAVLYLELSPEEVDVNVHPTKREVRFRDGRKIGRIVADSISKALRELTAEMVPKTNRVITAVENSFPKPYSQGKLVNNPKQSSAISRPGSSPVREKTSTHTANNARNSQPPSADTDNELGQNRNSPESALSAKGDRQSGASPSAVSGELFARLRVIGTMRRLYLIAEAEEGLVLIDHHAAHERILFEKLLRQAKNKKKSLQPLLFPVNIDFPSADAVFLQNNLDAFFNLGFQIEPFGGGSFLVSAVPPYLPRENIEGLMRDLFEELRTTGTLGSGRLNEQKLAQAACKHAVRAEDKLSEKEIQKLLADLAGTEMPYTCPHGRPVMINIPAQEIEKRFGRRI